MGSELDRAIANLELRLPKTSLGGWNFGNEIPAWRTCLQIMQSMDGAEGKLREIGRERNVEQLLDLLAEVKFAVIFSQLGFIVEVTPHIAGRGKGHRPDLRVARDNSSSVVEVKRFRPPGRFSPGRRMTHFVDTAKAIHRFQEYGDLPMDIRKVAFEIEGKFRQASSDGIIAIWNSNDELSPEEVDAATSRLRLQSNQRRKPAFVLLRGDPGERFACFALQNQLMQQHVQWIEELTQVVPDAILAGLSSEAKLG